MSKRNEFDQQNDHTLKDLIIKLFLIITIIIVLVWLIPKFFLYKKSKKHEEINEKNEIVIIENSTVDSVENAGVKYFNGENVPIKENENKKVTLKELQKNKLIGTVKNIDVMCDNDNSYVELTKSDNKYVLKTYVKCSSGNKQKTTYLNNYSYCNSSYLCQRDEEKEKQIQEVDKNNINMPSTGINDKEIRELTDFGPWKNYRKVSCDKQEIICEINNTNCLREVKVEKKLELIDENNKIYEEVCYSSERIREYK